MKCGTTSLYYYLGQHPEIFMSREKEPRFFIDSQNARKGLDWYESLFPDVSARVRGEASPQYSSYPTHRGVAQRMHELVPEAKLIYLVRDPIERIVSDYMGHYANRLEHQPISDAVAPSPTNEYVCRSRYHAQLEQFLRYYPRERILVLSQSELMRERRASLRRVFGFLDVDPSFDSARFDEIKRPSTELRRINDRFSRASRTLLPTPGGRLEGRLSWRTRARMKRILYRPVSRPLRRPQLEPKLRAALVEYLKPDTDRLRDLTGIRFQGWSV